jgi:predicted transposase YbfD/YdcC
MKGPVGRYELLLLLTRDQFRDLPWMSGIGPTLDPGVAVAKLTKEQQRLELLELLEGLPDPRIDRTRRHKLVDLLTIAICGGLCGVDNFVELERFGRAKESWFRTFLELPNGIASHDTFGRVLAALDPDRFRDLFVRWVASWAYELNQSGHIAIDGKTLRASLDRASGLPPVHMVNAFATDTGLTLAQVKTDTKSNEITAVPALLEMLRLKGCIVTADALNCQTKIVEAIVAGGGDYILAVKENQKTMHDEVALYFDPVRCEELKARKDRSRQNPPTYMKTQDQAHGRKEVREYWYTTDVEWFQDRSKWANLNGFGRVRRVRMVNGKTSEEVTHFISSLATQDVARFASTVRAHWAVENALHWVLDIAFDEDRNRARMGHAGENYAMIRGVALNLLKQEKSAKVGIKCKRKMCGWDHPYLLQVLRGNPLASS